MLAATLSDFLVILVRPDQQDYYGTAVLTEIASKLEIPRLGIIANKVHSRLDTDELRARLKQAFGCDVLGILPLSEDFAELGSESLFVRRYPEHPISAEIRAITQHIMQS
ncbi:MAG: hypothetical protein L0Y39_04810 [Methylococcaceae bacterium]|nr:hypothetical protein [Methylococcaceae bacterium]